jgi:hypothetical protein
MAMFSQIDCPKAPFPKLAQQTILANVLTQRFLAFCHSYLFLLSMHSIDRSIKREGDYGVS